MTVIPKTGVTVITVLQNKDNETKIRMITMKRKTLSSAVVQEYFYINNFCLPWFQDNNVQPHIIAVVTNFWTNTKSLMIDMDSKPAKIDVWTVKTRY